MSVETQADRMAMLADWDAAVWEGVSIMGVFDAPYANPLQIDNTQPTFTTDEDGVDGIAQGDTLTVGSTDYTVRALEPDGVGMLRLILETA